MGFLDTKRKAAELDKREAEAKAVNVENAAVAGYTQALKDAQLAQMQREYEAAGLAHMAANPNPQGFANVPGQEMGAGYQMPVDQTDARFSAPLLKEGLSSYGRTR